MVGARDARPTVTEAVERLSAREGKRAARLQHANIVPLHSAGVAVGLLCGEAVSACRVDSAERLA